MPVVDRGTHEAEDLGAAPGVEVAGGLVAEHDRRAADQRPGDGDALLLAARQLGGLVAQPVAEADRADHVVEERLVDLAAGQA